VDAIGPSRQQLLPDLSMGSESKGPADPPQTKTQDGRSDAASESEFPDDFEDELSDSDTRAGRTR